MADKDSDEMFARALQEEFDKEFEEVSKMQRDDEKLAHSIAKSSHNISDSEDSNSDTESDENTSISMDTSQSPQSINNSSQSPKSMDKSTSPKAMVKSSQSPKSMNKNQSPKSDAKPPQSYLQSVIQNSTKSSNSKRPVCKYGSACYRKNPIHLAEYYHPSKTDDKTDTDSPAKKFKKSDSNSNTPVNKIKKSDSNQSPHSNSSNGQNHNSLNNSNTKPKIIKKYGFDEALRRSSPFNLFLNKIKELKETHSDPLSLVFPDLLKPELGTLVESAQLNFMVDLDFLLSSYKAMNVETKPLLVMYGQIDDSQATKTSNVICNQVDMPYLYGTHHTKMMLFLYSNGMRVVVHTANLTVDDMFSKTQGFWVSPVFPLLDNNKSSLLEGESPTKFKSDLIEYLLTYKNQDLTRWTHIIKKHDFTKCNVVFVASAPGYHAMNNKEKWGHLKLRQAIKANSAGWKPSENLPIIAQCSSIGSLGASSKTWLETELGASLSGGVKSSGFPSPVSLIYPSEDDVRWSSQGYEGGICLPYHMKTHVKQLWLRQFLHNWRSESRKRTKSMPHIKTYTRLSKSQSTAQFFLLTSANLSKAAWGQMQKDNTQLFIRSYEAGVLFLPKFVTKTDAFELGKDKHLILPYDLPLNPYPSNAEPWFMDTKKVTPDVFGNRYR